MKLRSLPTLAALLAGAATLSAQAVQVNALVEFWYTQMLDNNLRLNSTAKPGGIATPSTAVAYYDGLSSGRFQENTFAIKRTEISLNGKVSDSLSWYVMFDPNLGNTPTVPNNVLQDAFITWDLGPGPGLRPESRTIQDADHL